MPPTFSSTSCLVGQRVHNLITGHISGGSLHPLYRNSRRAYDTLSVAVRSSSKTIVLEPCRHGIAVTIAGLPLLLAQFAFWRGAQSITSSPQRKRFPATQQSVSRWSRWRIC